jgi:hypothetical protein
MFRLLSVIFMSVLICVSYAFGKSIKAIGTQRRSFSSKIGIHLIGNYTPGTQKNGSCKNARFENIGSLAAND